MLYKYNIKESKLSLVDWVKTNDEQCHSIWDTNWVTLLHRQNKQDIEQYLTSVCLSVLDLSENEQVFVVRTIFTSIITQILRTHHDKQSLHPSTINEAYTMIQKIESWKNVSQFILGITDFLNIVINKIINHLPLKNTNPHLENAIQLINDNITNKDLSVKWLANKLTISTTHLSNLFRLYMGINTSVYISERKIAEISYDIAHTNKSLARIREKYGFVSHSHFIQFFKRYKHLTPLQYRQHARQIATK